MFLADSRSLGDFTKQDDTPRVRGAIVNDEINEVWAEATVAVVASDVDDDVDDEDVG